ncbi:MAG TPA: DUF429 domain-containing protein [archaeon]|nr:DUF429 domain-containing protein [archaeon]
MYFVGIDLAWSTKNGSGVAILEGNKKQAKLICADSLMSNEEIINYIKKHTKNKPALIAIDAPLIVPNETGRRIPEELTGKLFRQFDAGAHPSNRQRLSLWTGTIRGEEISKVLEKEGFKQDPYINQFEESKKFFEVYPHPSMVVLFNLKKILKYKSKPKRDYEFRYIEFRKYIDALKNLEKSNPSLILSKEILSVDLNSLKAQKLKDYEDTLDGIFCAYLSYYVWAKPNNCEVLGDLKSGYILTPVFDYQKKELKTILSQKTIFEYK